MKINGRWIRIYPFEYETTYKQFINSKPNLKYKQLIGINVIKVGL